MKKKKSKQSDQLTLLDCESVAPVYSEPEKIQKVVEPIDLESIGLNAVWRNFGDYIKTRGNSTLITMILFSLLFSCSVPPFKSNGEPRKLTNSQKWFRDHPKTKIGF